MTPLASSGNSKRPTQTYLSRSLSLTILDQYQNELSVQTNVTDQIEIRIPRDPNFLLPPMIRQNSTSSNAEISNELFHFFYVDLTAWQSISLHFQLRSLNTSMAHLLIYKFDGAPLLNSSIRLIDGWTVLDSSSI
jgi:hypothetical protein